MLACPTGVRVGLAARLRQSFTNPADPFAPRLPTSAGAPLNSIGHQRRLSGPTLPGVAPNVDTLYSLAWLDLAEEPFVLEAPDFGSPYYSFQIGYADTRADLSLGARTHGSQLPAIFISGPGDPTAVPPRMLHVTSHTRYLLVAGANPRSARRPGDHEAACDLQLQIRLRTLSRYLASDDRANPVPEQRPLDEGNGGGGGELALLNELGNVLRDWVVTPQEHGLIDSFRRIGSTGTASCSPATRCRRSTPSGRSRCTGATPIRSCRTGSGATRSATERPG